jgi:hypothetical protein
VAAGIFPERTSFALFTQPVSPQRLPLTHASC